MQEENVCDGGIIILDNSMRSGLSPIGGQFAENLARHVQAHLEIPRSASTSERTQ